MVNYSRVVEFIMACSHLLEQEAKINKTTFKDLLDIDDRNYKEETLTSVWNMADINSLYEEGHISKDEKYELTCNLEENLRILAKANLLGELLKEIQLAEKYNPIVDFRVGYKFKYSGDEVAEVLDFKLAPGIFNKFMNEGLALCKIEDPARPYVVWKIYIKGLNEKDALCLGGGEYFITEEAAQEYFNLQSV